MTIVRQASAVRVFLGAADGSEIDPETGEVNYLVPLMLAWRAGGSELDHAEFRYELARTGEHIQNMQTPTGWSRQVEVRLYHADGSWVPLFWGDLTGQQISVADGEFANVSARVFPYHFGKPLEGPETHDPRSGEFRTLPMDIEFNPLIDGVIEGNMSSRTKFGQYHVWGDPESFRSTPAEDYQGETLSRWSLKEAVKSLCKTCNPDEEFIKNPDDFSMFDEAAPEPQNLILPWGRYLPEYLDGLLKPHGFDWCLALSASGAKTVRRIVFHRRGDGPQFALPMQALGQTIDLDQTVCSGFQLSVDVGGLANEILLRGAAKQYEVTIELYRGWAESDDALTSSDLDKASPGSQYNTSGKTAAWRIWVANEAGDYCETRTTVAPIPDEPPDWSEYGVRIPRRRVIEDPLTFAVDGKRLPPQLEWSADAGSSWKPVPPSWDYAIYQTQMAIEFVGDRPPAELMAAGDDARLRVSCTLTADERIEKRAEKRPETPNGRKVVAAIDVSDRFQFREIATTGDLASELNSGSDPADTRDDSDALESLAERLRADEESAHMTGSFTLIDLVTDYWIGDMLTKVSGREISLNRNSAGGTPKYLQISGVTWFPQQRRTQLLTRAEEPTEYYQG